MYEAGVDLGFHAMHLRDFVEHCGPALKKVCVLLDQRGDAISIREQRIPKELVVLRQSAAFVSLDDAVVGDAHLLLYMAGCGGRGGRRLRS